MGEVCSRLSELSAHLSVILIFFMWIAGDIPNRVDIEWFKRGGGMVGHDHPPAYRFNGGQKVIYSIVLLGASAIAVSGYVLIFPFYGTDIQSMQTAEVAHSFIATMFIAAMIRLIYIGTIGMEGAYQNMRDGVADETWAKEHHELWYNDVKSGKAAAKSGSNPQASVQTQQ